MNWFNMSTNVLTITSNKWWRVSVFGFGEWRLLKYFYFLINLQSWSKFQVHVSDDILALQQH